MAALLSEEQSLRAHHGPCAGEAPSLPALSNAERHRCDWSLHFKTPQGHSQQALICLLFLTLSKSTHGVLSLNRLIIQEIMNHFTFYLQWFLETEKHFFLPNKFWIFDMKWLDPSWSRRAALWGWRCELHSSCHEQEAVRGWRWGVIENHLLVFSSLSWSPNLTSLQTWSWNRSSFSCSLRMRKVNSSSSSSLFPFSHPRVPTSIRPNRLNCFPPAAGTEARRGTNPVRCT